MTQNRISRRKFLSSSTCAIGLSSNAVATAFQLGLANAAMADTSSEVKDYKALVCIFLHSGNDSFNMLVPASPEEHKLYKKTRGELALQLSDSGVNPAHAQLLNPADDNRLFAVHPTLAELRNLYNRRELAFLANVGTLVEPTTVRDYRRRSVKLPLSLFSHNDQRDQWHTAIPQSRGTSGWIGRATEFLLDTNNARALSTNFSLSGNNLLQTGSSVNPFSVSANGGMALNNPAANLVLNQSPSGNNLLSNVFRQNSSKSIEKNRQYAQIINETPEIPNLYPDTALAKALKATARTISARKQLGAQRQSFFVQTTGWQQDGTHTKIC